MPLRRGWHRPQHPSHSELVVDAREAGAEPPTRGGRHSLAVLTSSAGSRFSRRIAAASRLAHAPQSRTSIPRTLASVPCPIVVTSPVPESIR